MDVHEAANIFPIDEEHIAELGRDIAANGQIIPIELCDGKVIDGRRRLRACELAGVEPRFTNVSPPDPVAYVLSLNLHRRQLTASQRSMVAARARDIYDRQAKERQQAATVKGNKTRHGIEMPVVENLPPLATPEKARDAAGKAVGVSGKLVDSATKVIEKAVPELAAAVDEGRMSVSAAAEIADEPPEVQKQVAREAKFSGGRYRKPVVKSEEPEPTGEIKGKGVIIANEAINCLARIPKNDALRKRGFQIVMDWIKANK